MSKYYTVVSRYPNIGYRGKLNNWTWTCSVIEVFQFTSINKHTLITQQKTFRYRGIQLSKLRFWYFENRKFGYQGTTVCWFTIVCRQFKMWKNTFRETALTKKYISLVFRLSCWCTTIAMESDTLGLESGNQKMLKFLNLKFVW